MRRPSVLGLVAAGIAVVVDAGYVAILVAEGEGDALWLACLIGIGALAALGGSLAARADVRIGLLAVAALVLVGVGILGLFSIGLPLLVAAALAAAGCASTVGGRPPPRSG